MSLVLTPLWPPSRVRLRTEYGCGHNILLLPRPWSIYQSRVCALAIHSNDAMIYIGQHKTAKNSSLFIFWKNKNISIGCVCVSRTEKKKQSNTQVGPTRIYIYRPCQVGLHCYIYYIGSGGYFSLSLSRLSALDIHKEHWETLLPASGAEEARTGTVHPFQHNISFLFFFRFFLAGRGWNAGTLVIRSSYI